MILICDCLCENHPYWHIYEKNRFVTVSAKTVLNGTFIITRKTDLKYSSCCGSVVLDFTV